MRHRYPLLIFVTMLMVLVGAYFAYTQIESKAGLLPFSVTIADAHTAVVEPIADIPLPQGMQTGSRIDLQASSPAARSALLVGILVRIGVLGEAQAYDFMLRKGNALVSVPVASVRGGVATGLHILH